MSTPALFDNPGDPSSGELIERIVPDPGSAQDSSIATQSLYRKFRPQSFDENELVGQDAIVRTLRNAIQRDRVAHAYLFSGPRGTGKTTTARLLAKAVNCTHPDPNSRPCNACAACLAISEGSAIDVVEIDAASNRGIDDVRELRERVKFAPAQLKTKFYIIDEAHQITGAAANAFLKTLEEPPPHTRFVLATTDPEQLLSTIVSRCQRFEFKRIPLAATRQRLAYVAAQEGLRIDDAAMEVIAKQAAGSLRDALGLVDQMAAYRRNVGEGKDDPISVDDVRDLLGLSRDELIVLIVGSLARRDAAEALRLLHQATDGGADPRQVNKQIVQFMRAIMHYLADPGSTSDEEVVRVASLFTLGEAMAEAQRFSELDFKVRHSSIPQLPLEIGIVGSVLRQPPGTPEDAASTQRSGQQTVQQGSQPAQPSGNPPLGPLIDRVRAPSSASGATVRQSEQRQRPTPQPSPPGANPGTGSITIDQIRAQWDQIRANLKARSRRVDALLMSVDPAAVQGDTVILSSAYPFHRNKLSEPEVKTIIEEVVSHVVGRAMQVFTVLHGEAPAARSSPSAGDGRIDGGTGSNVAESKPVPSAALSDADRRTLDAAKNIFDAEEIGP